LSRFRKYRLALRLGYGAFAVFSLLVVCAIVGLSCGALIYLPSTARLIYLGLSLLVLITVLSYHLLRPILRREGRRSLAVKLEEAFPQLEDNLIASVELESRLTENPENYSPDLIRAIINKAAQLIEGVDYRQALDKGPLLKWGKFSVGLLLAALLLMLLFPGPLRDSLYLFSHPLTEIERPPEFFFETFPGDAEILKNEPLLVQARTVGKKPSEVEIHWRNEGSEALFKDKMTPRAISGGDSSDYDFSHEFEEVRHSFRYELQAGGERSPQYTVTVLDPPRITGLKLTFRYPRYSGIPSTVVDENDGNIIALVGTGVTMEASSNKNLDTAKLVFDRGKHSEMEVKGARATVEIRVDREDSYHLELADSSGNRNPDPITYRITPLIDAYPTVEITSPGANIDLNESKLLPISFEAYDDYGFSDLELHYTLESEGQKSSEWSVGIPLGGKGGTHLLSGHNWDLTNLGMIPGDVVTYYLKIHDNDRISGPKPAKSRSYTARFPSLDEILSDLDIRREREVFNLEEVLRQERQLQEKLREFSRELRRKAPEEWHEKKELESAAKEQQQLSDRLAEVADQMEESISKAEENRLNTLEMLSKMMEVRQLLEEIATPELKETLRRLQEAIERMKPAELRKALENFQTSQEELIQNLERTLALLKQLQLEQKLDELAQLAEKLLEEQDDINQSCQSTQTPEEQNQLARRESQQGEDFQTLQEQFSSFKSCCQGSQLLPQESLKQAEQQLESEEIPENISEAQQNLQEGQMKKAGQCGGQLSKSFASLLNTFQNMQQCMNSCLTAEITEAIKKAAFDLLYLSGRQEELHEQVSDRKYRDPELRTLARGQKNLESGTYRVLEEVREISEMTLYVPFEVSKTVSLAAGEMEAAVTKLDARNPNGRINQVEAMANLNRAADMLLKSLDQMKGSGSASGASEMMQQLQSLAGRQESLNQQTMQALGDQQRLFMSHQDVMGRLAAEQEAIKEALRELFERMEGEGKALGRLEGTEEEMDRVVEELQRKRLNQDLVERQERILTRLLDYQKSLHRQDYTRKRKAEVGEETVRRSPSELTDLGEKRDEREEEIKRALKERYPLQYEELVKAYFKRLSESLSKEE
jgi:hypothetical protein